jgi:hypothetical protein
METMDLSLIPTKAASPAPSPFAAPDEFDGIPTVLPRPQSVGGRRFAVAVAE